MPLGKPSISDPRVFDLRAFQAAVSNTRQRIEALETEAATLRVQLQSVSRSASVSGGGSGTVVSVAATVPDFLSLTGSPITTSGTLAFGLVDQPPGCVFAGPISGADAVPTFRQLQWYYDLPLYSSASFTSGLSGDEIVLVERYGEFVWTTVRDIANHGGGVSVFGAYQAKLLCAALEAEATTLQRGTFSVSITTTQLLLAAYQTRIGSTGRFEKRIPGSFPLTSASFSGTGSDSGAVLVDPTPLSYSDPWQTYYERLDYISSAATKVVTASGSGGFAVFLPGPYGSIVTHSVVFDAPWTVLRQLGRTTFGVNLMNEISDTAAERHTEQLMFPVSKNTGFCGVVLGTIGSGSPSGAVTFVILPDWWSVVPDPISSSYTFRDDFMAPALAGTWNVVQSTVGNVAIDTTFQWCKFTGNSAWGTNGLYSTYSVARSTQPTVVVDFYPGITTASGGSGAGMVGFHDGVGTTFTAMAHAVNFASSAGLGVLQVYENGTLRGTVGSGWTENAIYRIRIRALSGGGAVYEIQGGTQYAAIGGSTWSTLTPGATNSATSTFRVGGYSFAGANFVSDFRVFV